MSVRKYVGMDISKARQEKLTQVHSNSTAIKKRGRKQRKVLDISAAAPVLLAKQEELELDQSSNSTKELTLEKQPQPLEEVP